MTQHIPPHTQKSADLFDHLSSRDRAHAAQRDADARARAPSPPSSSTRGVLRVSRAWRCDRARAARGNDRFASALLGFTLIRTMMIGTTSVMRAMGDFASTSGSTSSSSSSSSSRRASRCAQARASGAGARSGGRRSRSPAPAPSRSGASKRVPSEAVSRSSTPSDADWVEKYGNRRLNYRLQARAVDGATSGGAARGVFVDEEGAGAEAEDEDEEYKVGVLLLNLGGPETLDDVQPFLYNLFADPDIIRLPQALQFLQGALASILSASRAPKSREAYESIGGGSPLRRITDDQARALQGALDARGVQAKTYVGMRYWKPFTEDAIADIKRDGVNRLVVLPLYPQFSISTSGSSLRLLEQYFSEDEQLARVRHTVIPSWYQRPGYVKAMAQLISQTLNDKFDDNKEPIIFFSAHGVPVSYVEDAGDPYKAEMEECVQLIVDELRQMGVSNEHVLAYQSRVGPVEWLKPYTDDTIRQLGRDGTKAMCAVPISFVSEHIETLEEIDMEYRELAEENGIEKWGRVPALDTDPLFIDDLAKAVIEALPYTTRMNSRIGEVTRASITGVPTAAVGDLLASYDRDKLAIPVPDSSWNKKADGRGANRAGEFSGSDPAQTTTNDLVNFAVVFFAVFFFLQVRAGANGLFGATGIFQHW